MSSASEELIEKIRQERLGMGQVASTPYAKLIVFPSLRRQLLLIMLFAFGTVCYLILKDFHTSKPWWNLVFPVTGVGLLLCLFPPTEMWEYAPWQSRSRRYERHQIEK
jgi:hypothetical protein